MQLTVRATASSAVSLVQFLSTNVFIVGYCITTLTLSVRLRECLPTSINQIQYDSGNQNGYVAIEVTFAYRDWLNFGLDIDSTGKVGGLSSGVVKAGGGLFSGLPPELRRTGRNVINQLKRSIPIGRVFGGKVFPPFTF